MERSKLVILSGRCKRPPLLTFVLWVCHSTGGLRSCFSCSSGDRGAGVGPLLLQTRSATCTERYKSPHTGPLGVGIYCTQVKIPIPKNSPCVTIPLTKNSQHTEGSYWWYGWWHWVSSWHISDQFWHSSLPPLEIREASWYINCEDTCTCHIIYMRTPHKMSL